MFNYGLNTLTHTSLRRLTPVIRHDVLCYKTKFKCYLIISFENINGSDTISVRIISYVQSYGNINTQNGRQYIETSYCLRQSVNY